MDLAEVLASPEFAAMYQGIAQRGKDSLQKKYEDLNQLAQTGRPVLAGDSIVEYFPVQELLQGAAYNRGVGGDTTRETLERLPKIVLPLKPAKLFFWVGTNDIQDGISLEDTLANMSAIIDTVKRVLPETQVHILSVCPVNIHSEDWNLRHSVGSRNNEAIICMNAGYRRLAAEKGCTYIDLYPLLEKEGSLPEEYSDDGLHLTIPAYRIVCAALEPYL